MRLQLIRVNEDGVSVRWKLADGVLPITLVVPAKKQHLQGWQQ